jgi:hypothetical protein
LKAILKDDYRAGRYNTSTTIAVQPTESGWVRDTYFSPAPACAFDASRQGAVMRRTLGLSVLAVGLLGSPSGLYAQALGTIAGVVKDPSDAVLPGVTVEASSPALIEKTRSVVTDGRGQFSIVNLPPGNYDVSFNLTGFSTVNRQAVQVSVGVTVTVNITMRVGAVAETVTVTGETPVVDLQSTAQTTVANARAFKELPTGGSWVNMAQIIQPRFVKFQMRWDF